MPPVSPPFVADEYIVFRHYPPLLNGGNGKGRATLRYPICHRCAPRPNTHRLHAIAAITTFALDETLSSDRRQGALDETLSSDRRQGASKNLNGMGVWGEYEHNRL